MKKWFFLLVIIALVSLQLTWPVFLSFFNCKPDFLLVLVVALVFYLDFKIALVFALLTGLTKDAFLPGFFAVNTILFCIWSYLVHLLSRQISTENGYVRVAIVLIAALLNNIISGLQIINSGLIIPPAIFLRNLIISSTYTATVSPLIFKFTKKIVS
ncbi:MAG: rod shape-determining protein MreD [Candidatus Omnitrophica bacterium]|nr:rod shape-determining protein MreD [Candidatus Omnitrophota bacterium]